MKDFLKDIIQEIKKMGTWISDKCRNTKYGIKNLIVWFPVIWKDKQWDHTHIYEIFKKKLELQSNSIRKYGHHVDSKRDADNMMKCVYTLNRLLSDVYHEMAFKRHKEIWGRPSYEFKSIDDNWSELFMEYPSAVTEKDKEKERKHFRRCIKHEDMLKKQDLEYLTTMMKKHIESWWD